MRNPHRLWHDGAFFGVVAGALSTTYVVYLAAVTPVCDFGWAILGLPFLLVVAIILAVWAYSRQHLRFQARRAARLKSQDDRRLCAESEIQAAEDLVDAGTDDDPYAGYMICCRQLWRLQVKGLDGCEAGDQLREQMDSYWARMDRDQRGRAELEAADVWKYALDDDNNL